MKKQILFLAMFTLALIFAGINNVFGQVDDAALDAAIAACPVPAVLNCGTGGALTPLPGQVYTYDIAVTGTGTTIHWFVTTDLNVIATGAVLTSNIEQPGGTYVLTAGTSTLTGNATYDDAANEGDILEVSWNYFTATPPVLLVAFAVDAAGCTNNIEVYRIEPIFNFVLDIAALEDDGTIQDPANSKECVSPIQSATYADGTGLTVDYGDNYIYYIVSAANFVNSWTPTWVVPTSTGGSTVGAIQWAYNDGTDLTLATWNAATVPVLAQDASGTVGATGECIIVRINILHGSVNEFVAAETYTLGVNGVMYDAADGDYGNTSLADLDDDPANPGTCINTVTDEAGYIITPRPDVTDEDPTPFETKIPSATP